MRVRSCQDPISLVPQRRCEIVQKPTQIEKDKALSEGMRGMMPNMSEKSKLLQVLTWRPVRLGRCVMVARIVSSVSPEQL